MGHWDRHRHSRAPYDMTKLAWKRKRTTTDSRTWIMGGYITVIKRGRGGAGSRLLGGVVGIFARECEG